MDRFWRLAYRVGFRAARLWWRVRRPAHDGAVVAVWVDGRVLAVQQSYRTQPLLARRRHPPGRGAAGSGAS